MSTESSTTTQDLENLSKAEQREKGRFPLLVAGMVAPKPGKRATSGHGVGMLITWLHKAAMKARNDMLEQAKSYTKTAKAKATLHVGQLNDSLKQQQTTWAATLQQLKAL
jgi:hypothetical protein